MLNLFRKYQRIIYFFVTFVIIISFSFFGAGNTLGSNVWREQVAFRAINGHDVIRADVDDMNQFLATDASDKQEWGGAWGPNFLNDGVIRKDFLETGLAQELIFAYKDQLRESLIKKMEKEKKYIPYRNPQVSFIGIEQAWGYFAPALKNQFESLKLLNDPTDSQAIENRIQLYLSEKKFTPQMARQVLRYQEKQFSWVNPDPNLERIDLSLFGYHTLNDWFGPEFITLVSEFIINTAMIAESKGYEVSKAEVLADLARNNLVSYQENSSNPQLGVASPQEYYTEQLRLMNIDQSQAVKIWQKVLLFRRYFQDAGHSALMDTLAFQNFNNYSSETVKIDLYRLPTALRLSDNKSLQLFETYLQAVSGKRSEMMPDQLLSTGEVSKKYPELVQKLYTLELAQVNQKGLQSKIGIRELWSWESDEKNWDTLTKKFPELGIRPHATREERFSALEELDTTTRARLDAFAKESIVNSHPEWLDDALSSAEVKTVTVGIREGGRKAPLEGVSSLEKKQELIKLLDKAPIGVPASEGTPLYTYSPDSINFFRINVLSRNDTPEVLTFEEAFTDGTLGVVRDKILEEYYVANRDKKPEIYLDDEKEWQPFSRVKELVAEEYFQSTWEFIAPIKEQLAKDNPLYQTIGKDQLAALRFYKHAEKIQNLLNSDPSKAEAYIQNDGLKGNDNRLANQWQLVRESIEMSRRVNESAVDIDEALELEKGEWSPIKAPFNGDLVFFRVMDKSAGLGDKKLIAEQTRAAQAELSSSVQRTLMKKLLREYAEKEALSLSFLKKSEESSPVSESDMSVE